MNKIAKYYNFCDTSYQHWGQEKKDEVYEIHYGVYDKNHTTRKESLINMNRVVANALNPKQGDRVLDAGCGVGASSICLAKNYDVII